MRCGGFAALPAPLRGAWAFQGFPAVVTLLGRRFKRSAWAFPMPGVAAQYREDKPAGSLHVLVHTDGTWSADHTDDANPDRGLLLEHAIRDVAPTPVGRFLLFLAVVWGLKR